MIRDVLVVDDDVAVASSLALTLIAGGRRCSIAAGVNQARQQLANGTPDCVITDWRMPHEDGLGFAASLRRRDRELPVILMTAHVTDRTRQLAREAGCRAILSKPIDLDHLDRLLTDLEQPVEPSASWSSVGTSTDLLPDRNDRWEEDFHRSEAAPRIDPKAETDVYDAWEGLDPDEPVASPLREARRAQSLSRHNRSLQRRRRGRSLSWLFIVLLSALLTLGVGLLIVTMSARPWGA